MSAFCVPWFLDMPANAPELTLAGTPQLAMPPGLGDQTERLFPIHREVSDAIAGAGHAGMAVAVLGDCCQTIGVMAGLHRRGIQPTIVWLDSHGDFNTWETTPSGFLGGMPLAMLTGRGDQRLLENVELAPMTDEQVVLSDGRDLDPGERDLIAGSRITHMEDINQLTISALPDGPLYVHYDTDLLNADAAPSFHYPVAGGPGPQNIKTVLERLLQTRRVVAFSITAAWDTEKDADGATRDAVRASLPEELHG